jgi:hypothetical protein
MTEAKPWKYAVPYVNEKTGERRMIVVELTAEEKRDCTRNLMDPRAHGAHGAHGAPGGTSGPDAIANNYASRRANEQVPPDFLPVYEEIERVVVVH